MTMTTLTEASNVLPGDLLDLADDPYTKGETINRYQLAEVESVVQETPECVVIYTVENGTYGFPTAHQLIVVW